MPYFVLINQVLNSSVGQYSKTSLSRQTHLLLHERLGRISRHVFYLDKLPPSPLALATSYTSNLTCNLTSLCRHFRPVGGR